MDKVRIRLLNSARNIHLVLIFPADAYNKFSYTVNKNKQPISSTSDMFVLPLAKTSATSAPPGCFFFRSRCLRLLLRLPCLMCLFGSARTVRRRLESRYSICVCARALMCHNEPRSAAETDTASVTLEATHMAGGKVMLTGSLPPWS